jgi:hypothetical protein
VNALPEDTALREPSITTQVTRTKKPHDKFKLSLQLDSVPVEVTVEADTTEVGVADLRPNPKKYRFGTIRFKGAVLDACMYPLRNIDSVLWFLYADGLQRGRFITDQRRTRALLALIMRIRYFLALRKERKLQYLRRKGFFANINTIEGTLTVPEQRNLRQYEGIMRGP